MLTQPEQTSRIKNIEVEQALLGALLIDNDQIGTISGIIEAGDFTETIHVDIYELILKQFKANQPADVRTLKSYIEAADLGDMTAQGYIASLYENAATSLAKPYAELLRTMSLRRMLIGVGQEIEDMAYKASPTIKAEALVDDAEKIIANCRQQFRRQGHDMTMGRIYDNAMQAAQDAMNASEPIGHRWFIPELGIITGALIQNTYLYGLMAPSGGGKSSMILQQLRHSAVVDNVPCLFFSFEQDEQQCFYQMCSQHLGFETLDIQNNKLSNDQFDAMNEQSQILRKAPLRIEKVHGLKTADLAVRARSFHRTYGPGIIAVDHAKRVAPADFTSGLHQQVNQVYGDLKDIALDLDSAVFLLMQQNSDARRRTRPAPIMSDAYGGDGAAENLDCFIDLWREDEWLNRQIRLADREDQKDRLKDRLFKVEGRAEIIGLKARYGRSGIPRKIRYSKEFTRFESLRQAEPQEEFGL